MAKVTQLQGCNNEPKIAHLKRANALLKRARQDTSLVGLHYPRMTPPFLSQSDKRRQSHDEYLCIHRTASSRC
eukprot:8909346-Pyramimonas_sp.AAC.1